MNDTPNVGKLLGPGEGRRDAIHVAVCPARAAEGLMPGDRVGLTGKDLEEVGVGAKFLVGIVDPYLSAPVKKGERFWLFLFPGTVTSLRHVWTHPAFEAASRQIIGETTEKLRKAIREG